jgi:hypothetical protein
MEGQDMDRNSILNWIFKKWDDERVWIGLIWHRMDANDELF